MKACWSVLAILSLCLAAPQASAADKHKEAAAAGKMSAAVIAWRIVPDKGSVGFTATQLGQQFTGKFGVFSGDLVLDPANLAQAKLTATVDLGSVDAGDTQRNQALPGEDWFDSAKYPRATFKSHKFVHKDGHGYEVTGMLTIKGVARQVTIPFSLTPNGDMAAIKGAFSIKRTDFTVGEGQWATGQWIGIDVKVTIDAVAVKAG